MISLGLAVRHVLLADEARRQSARATNADHRLHQSISHDSLTGLPNRSTAQSWIDVRLRRGVARGAW